MPRRLPLALLLLPLAACQRSQPAPTVSDAGATAVAPAPPPVAVAEPPAGPPAPDHRHEHAAAPLPVCEARGRPPLEAARTYADGGRPEAALACAAQAAALEPDLPAAHAERAMALAGLARFPEAQLAFARALALDPDDADALWGAAHLYAAQLPSSREHDELALLYSERGLGRAGTDGARVAEFALLSAMAFNDLGRADEALARAELVLAHDKADRDAAYERALALFELCRFDEAREAFTAIVKAPGDRSHDAHAYHHLGLLLEREGRGTEADAALARARALAPADFPAPPQLSPAEFSREVQRAVAALPPDMRRDLAGVPVTAEELPAEEDLLANQPPLSPTILGLYRGPPLGEACDGVEEPCRSVALYRRNLQRATTSRAELAEQIRVTLLHEVGHLRGEDDGELAARGLE